ncbi:hypothetical protein SISNIDRAFT_487871 [Sistotremastrum niveocremeum HHB9708]|uniref:Uncharacterized protein n=1 Tax=Sistotremastrum niveocremeum HHB9708 TaxID=1314777 RepID=A0A164RSX2_9AGAM|nr:hypothetical protein SISNIDRAFT_487871 [Sistotremastrum niveocremeum HHB9708]
MPSTQLVPANYRPAVVDPRIQKKPCPPPGKTFCGLCLETFDAGIQVAMHRVNWHDSPNRAATLVSCPLPGCGQRRRGPLSEIAIAQIYHFYETHTSETPFVCEIGAHHDDEQALLLPDRHPRPSDIDKHLLPCAPEQRDVTWTMESVATFPNGGRSVIVQHGEKRVMVVANVDGSFGSGEWREVTPDPSFMPFDHRDDQSQSQSQSQAQAQRVELEAGEIRSPSTSTSVTPPMSLSRTPSKSTIRTSGGTAIVRRQRSFQALPSPHKPLSNSNLKSVIKSRKMCLGNETQTQTQVVDGRMTLKIMKRRVVEETTEIDVTDELERASAPAGMRFVPGKQTEIGGSGILHRF